MVKNSTKLLYHICALKFIYSVTVTQPYTGTWMLPLSIKKVWIKLDFYNFLAVPFAILGVELWIDVCWEKMSSPSIQLIILAVSDLESRVDWDIFVIVLIEVLRQENERWRYGSASGTTK